MTRLYFCVFDAPLSPGIFAGRLEALPVAEQARIQQYRRWQDACASLTGKLLLQRGLADFGYSGGLDTLQRNQYDKPYLEGSAPAFNISHSGNLVACILTDETKHIGLDVEACANPQPADLTDCWNETEQQEINAGGTAVFYKYWTIKEAVLKVAGTGLAAGLKAIAIKGATVTRAGTQYYIHHTNSLSGYAVTVATDTPVSEPLLVAVYSREL